MKKIVFVGLIALLFGGCQIQTSKIVIENKSNFPAALKVEHVMENNENIILAPKQSASFSLIYPNTIKYSVSLRDGTRNYLTFVADNYCIIENIKPKKYNVNNFLPIPITLIDNGKNILAGDANAYNCVDSFKLDTNNVVCYFFKKIDIQDIFIKTDLEEKINDITYSIQRINTLYFLQIKKNPDHIENHKIDIDLFEDNIIFSY